jgi:hypothetical protein
MITYPTEETAVARMEALKRIGIWPAVILLPSGRWRLSVDLPGTIPSIAAERGLPNTRRTR